MCIAAVVMTEHGIYLDVASQLVPSATHVRPFCPPKPYQMLLPWERGLRKELRNMIYGVSRHSSHSCGNGLQVRALLTGGTLGDLHIQVQISSEAV